MTLAGPSLPVARSHLVDGHEGGIPEHLLNRAPAQRKTSVASTPWVERAAESQAEV